MKPTLFIALLVATGCRAEPRSASYFEAHPVEAERVVASCRTEDRVGEECRAAAEGLSALAANRRLELFKKSFE